MKVPDPMSLLIKHEGYPPAVLVAILLHGVLLYFVLGDRVFSADFVNVEELPTYINAQTIDVNPQRLRRLEQEAEQQAAARRRQQQEAEAARLREQQARERAEAEAAAQQRAAEEEQRRIAELARQEEARRQAEALRQEQEAEAARAERERQQELARQQEAAREAERARQAAAVRQAEQAAADARNVQAYTAIIHDTVTNNWSIPPSARNGMTAVVRLRLVPTGEIISSDIIQGSGDAAFDRSVLQALARAGRFPELQDMPIALFEQNFRLLTLTFRPEDLLR